MKELSGPKNDGVRADSVKNDRSATLSRLTRQAWWAAVVLFSPWLAAIFFYRSIFHDRPAAMLALLPGLAVAVHLQRQLFQSLTDNHPPLQQDHLFSTLGAANWISLLRAGAVVALAGFLPAAVQGGQGLRSGLAWVPGLLYLGLSLADLLDGFLARRKGRETLLGKRLDIETDAAGLLVASLVAAFLGRLPFIYILAGLAYYPFILGIRLRQRRGLPVVALISRPSSRIIAGCQMGLVGMALLPIFGPTFTFLAAWIFMTPLLLGFLRDWLVVSCRIQTTVDQQTNLDFTAGSLMKKLPMALRLALLFGGIAALVDFELYRSEVPWQLAESVLCLLAATGFLGRSAGLALLLLLGYSQSPFGTTTYSLLIFSAAAALMLSGTGPMSLWSPEEQLLYRRNSGKPESSSGKS